MGTRFLLLIFLPFLFLSCSLKEGEELDIENIGPYTNNVSLDFRVNKRDKDSITRNDKKGNLFFCAEKKIYSS